MTQDPPPTTAELEAFITAQNWRFASSMPQWPHWYCLLSETTDARGFWRFVHHIAREGYLAEFRPKSRKAWARRRYLDVGPYHYWTINKDLRRVHLINRALHPNAAHRIDEQLALPGL